jgi:hypothetical protein
VAVATISSDPTSDSMSARVRAERKEKEENDGRKEKERRGGRFTRWCIDGPRWVWQMHATIERGEGKISSDTKEKENRTLVASGEKEMEGRRKREEGNEEKDPQAKPREKEERREIPLDNNFCLCLNIVL